MTETANERKYRKALENTRDSLDHLEEKYADKEVYSEFYELRGQVEEGLKANNLDNTDKLSDEKLQEELDSCIQTLIDVSITANISENIIVGNIVDLKLAKLAMTHENVAKYIERATGKKIDVVLADNDALEAEEEI